MNNLELWNKVCETDPGFTKGFKRGGGFSGTATSPLYLIRKATELWGPLGGEWGFSVIDERYVTGAPIMKDGAKLGDEIVHVVRVELRHPGGKIESFGQTTFVGSNKYGAYTDEEAPKKSLTDAVTKALSWLGFSADIHMGLYDDSKYVAELQKKYAAKPELVDAEALSNALAKVLQTGGEKDKLIEAWGQLDESIQTATACEVLRQAPSIEALDAAMKYIPKSLREELVVKKCKDECKDRLIAGMADVRAAA